MVIHEKRFTYARDGLTLVQDLGEHWEQQTGYAIPLGAICARRSLNLAAPLDALIQRSLAWAYAHYAEAFALCQQYAQDLSEGVIESHIKLYVNEYTEALGAEGEAAVNFFLNKQKTILNSRRLLMRIAYFDCFSGVSGDMILGALLHAGVEEDAWRAELQKLNVPGYELKIEMVVKEGISGMDVDVVLHEEDQGHGRHLADIEEILGRSGLSENIRCRAMGAFTRLAHSEAKIHAMTPDTIHFHEVGAVDAIVDIVGACIGLEMLGVEKVYASPLPLNRGWVECAHGTMPVPAPATMELLVGFPLRPDDRPKELITPTGACLLAEYAERTPEWRCRSGSGPDSPRHRVRRGQAQLMDTQSAAAGCRRNLRRTDQEALWHTQNAGGTPAQSP